MAASNSTPIQLYYSNTPGSAPISTSLIIGELAINVPDGIIFYKDSSNNVNVIARTSAAAGQFANVTFGDGSIQYKSAAPWAYTNSIHTQANTAITDIIYLQGVNAAQNTTIGSGQSYANGAFGRANAAFQDANGAFIKANTAYQNTLDLAGVDVVQNTNISLSSSFANGAFTKANTNATNITNIQGVDTTQNTAIQNSWDHANGAFDHANTAYNLVVNGDTEARSYANGAFVQANTNATNIANVQGVDATQNTQITNVASFANGAFTKANTNANDIAYIQGVDASQNAHTTNVGVYANNAFTKANNALANTSNITVTNNLTVPGQANVYNRLAVGTGAYQVLPNLIAQFTGTSDTYSQVNQQNLSANGTGDFVITADNGTDATNYVDMGMAGSTYDNTTPNAFPMVNPNDGYFMVVGDSGASFGGNVFVGTSGSGAFGDIVFIQGNDYSEVARFRAGDKIEFYRPIVANSFTTVDGINVVTYTNTANTYLKGLIDTKVSKSGDTITGVLAVNAPSSANALSVSGNVYISNDLRVSGNLYIGGNATSISANNLTLDDSIIYLANNNNTNVIDIGIVGAFNDGKYQHTGFVRDANDGKWKLFSNVVSEPTTTIDFTDAIYDTLKLGTTETANIIVSGVDLAAHTNSAFGKANSAYNLADGKVSSVAGTSGRVSVSGTSTVTVDLATSGVVAGSYTYPSLQVDSYGRVTTISTQTPVTSFNTRTGAVSLGSGDVTSALGYTPVDTVNYNNDLLTQSSLDASQNTRIVNVGSFANGAFFKANTVGIYANGAFDLANTTNTLATNAGDFANGAFTKANSVGNFANGAFTYANTTNTLATNAGNFANGAFTYANTTNALTVNAYDKANSVGEFANGAFTYANTTNALTVNAYNKANNVGNFANGAFDMANTAYNTGGILVGVYANNAFGTANAAFIKANTVGEFANGAFLNANMAFDMANAAYSVGGISVGVYANGAFTTANAAFDKANVTYSLADAAFLRANVSFDTANTNATKITFTGTYANGAFTKANTVGDIVNLAYDKANNSSQYANGAFELANTTNTLATNAGNFANGAFVASNTTNTLATNAGNFANGSFSRANAAFDLTNTAYGWANTVYSNYAYPAYSNTLDLAIVNAAQNTNISLASSFANGAFNTANAGFVKANNVGDVANASYTLANTNATTLTLTQSYANGAFEQSNTNATAITNLQSVNVSQNTSISSALSIATSAFDTANAEVIGTGAFSRANASYGLANTNATTISNLQGVDAWQNTYSQQIHSTSNGAFVKANSAWTLANDAYAYANTLVTGGTSIDGWARNQANSAYDTANGSFTAANTSLSYALSSFQKANSIVSPTYTTSDTPPNNPSTSAIWYNTATDVMYQWVTSDGTNYYWIDIGSPTVTVGNTVISYTYTGYGRAAAHAMIFGGF